MPQEHKEHEEGEGTGDVWKDIGVPFYRGKEVLGGCNKGGREQE